MVDPAGSAIALIVLGLLIISVLVVGISWLRNGLPSGVATGWQVWIIPVLALAGLGVASYLAFVETTASEAVCGPVGDCNAVQQSPYASLFGILPIGVLGVIGYLVILALWLWQRYGPAQTTAKTAWMLPAVSIFGVLFSIYLTFLEPFVIAAVCMWCITSAVIMLLLLWTSFLWRVPGAWKSVSSESCFVVSERLICLLLSLLHYLVLTVMYNCIRHSNRMIIRFPIHYAVCSCLVMCMQSA